MREVSALFLKLGVLGFGGPAAHIAMFREEAVNRRKWLSDQRFMDLVGATSLIPGPNSTEMAIHLGLERAGWRGLVAAGALFILPAFLIVTGLAWVYVEFNEVPALQWALYGIKPAVIAIVVNAIVGLAKTALGKVWTLVLAVGVLTLYIVGVNELILLAAAGGIGLLARAREWPGPGGRALFGLLPLGAMPAVLTAASTFSLGHLFLLFLKIGAVLYGSGYVLLAFMQGDFVDRLGWLTQQQLLDAVAVGQMTPGPVFTTASFVGYILGGWSGAVLATVAIFLPSFVFVAMLNPLVARVRADRRASGFLDGVNAAAIALMIGVAATLGRAAIVDVFTGVLAAVSLALVIRFRTTATWLVPAGAVLGVIYQLVVQ
ncbi:MAG: chromate efflux transporter [Chloroflexi bacterium]|nr:chromate efflux transporter [Chloroflexota bacterium]